MNKDTNTIDCYIRVWMSSILADVPAGDGLQPKSDGLQPKSNSDGLQPTSDRVWICLDKFYFDF